MIVASLLCNKMSIIEGVKCKSCYSQKFHSSFNRKWAEDIDKDGVVLHVMNLIINVNHFLFELVH